jgi:Icc-related predicted phosphoesterase
MFQLPSLETDKDDVLVLAGDIGLAVKPGQTLGPVTEWAKGFRKVIHICGNHEYYHGSLLRVKDKIREFYKEYEPHNIAFADCEVVRVDNVSFVCATLWTNFNKGNPLAMMSAQQGLNDYKLIRTGVYDMPYMRRMNAYDVFNLHMIDKDFIFRSIAEEKAAGQKVVVVSHHGPSTLSVDTKRYGNDIINWAYVSNLEEQILDTKPDIYVHGHTHTSFDYIIGDTRVITNPRGYQHEKAAYPENRNFNPTLRIEV